MRRHVLGSTGLELSAVGLGGVWFRADDAAAANGVLAASYDAGVNWVDTAEGYGNGDNETSLGQALRSVPEMMVASKISPWRTPLHHDGVHRACRASLQRLQRDVLDVYFVHAPAADVPLEETWTAMAELADQGLVRAIGLSNFSTDDVRRAHAIRAVDMVQDGLSLIDMLDARQHFAACAELGVAGVVFEPVAGGLLTGAITADTDVSGQKEWGPIYERIFAPGRIERSLAVAERLGALAAEWGYTMSQLAIAWCLHQTGVTAALAGTKCTEHTLSNARAGDITFTETQLTSLDDLISLGPTFA
jgi:aryl-alcohol dehydrogenase-like predicted oxidoreductase